MGNHLLPTLNLLHFFQIPQISGNILQVTCPFAGNVPTNRTFEVEDCWPKDAKARARSHNFRVNRRILKLAICEALGILKYSFVGHLKDIWRCSIHNFCLACWCSIWSSNVWICRLFIYFGIWCSYHIHFIVILGDGLGEGYGMLGQAGNGRLRVSVGQSKLAAKVAKK